METDPPRTAKEAALLGAKANKPPFNREADRRHVVASLIRRVGEFTGQSELSAEVADGLQFDAPTSSLGDGPGTSDLTSSGPPYATESPTPIYSPAIIDLTLAQLVQADFAAERGFAFPSRTPNDEGDIAAPSFDLTRSAQSFLGILGPTGRDLSDDAASGVGPSTDLTNWLPGVREVSPIDPYSELESRPELRPAPNSPSRDAENLLYRLGEPQRFDHPVERLDQTRQFSRSDLLASDGPTADPPPPLEETPPVTFVPWGGIAPAADAAGEMARWQVELSVANVQKNSAIAYRAIETIILKAIDRAGEQDRIDALHREASHRACL